MDEQLEALPRKEIAETSLAQTGKIILAKDMDTVVQMANLSAPEHMEIMTENAFSLVPRIRNAGAIFLGAYSPEPLGDYYAGPNHILPTGGTARFYSVLNVETFMKKTSLISYTREPSKRLRMISLPWQKQRASKPMPMPSASAKGNYKKGGSR